MKGFTVVELIIVIIVIGILAAILVVSYNGSIKNSYNSQVISGVKTYYDAIQTYYTQYHKYPTTSVEQSGNAIAMTCLGVGYANQTCGSVSDTVINEDTLFNQTMNTFLKSSSGPIANRIIPVPGESYVGAVYGIDQVDNPKSTSGYGRVIEYALHGANKNCGISDAYQYSTNAQGTACEIFLENYIP